MNDDQTLTVIRDHLAEAQHSLGDLPAGVPASEIFARVGKRRRRRAVTALAAACAIIGLVLAVVLPSGTQRTPVHVHLAAWSVDTNPDGTVTFKLRSVSHPAQLQRVLAEAGVSALVRSGKICLAQGRHVLLPTEGIVSELNGQPNRLESIFLLGGNGRGPNKLLNWAWTIIPSKIPSNAHFVISSIPGSHIPANRIKAAWEFVPKSAHVNCAVSVKLEG
jgi:hypothetical protein